MNEQQQKNLNRKVLGIIVLLVVFFSGSYLGQKTSNTTKGEVDIPENINITNEQFEPFWKVWKVLDEKHVSATTTDPQDRIWGAIKGLAGSQGDPYTVFFPPEEDKMFKGDIAGNFEGVGMEIGLKDGAMTVVSPIKGSPAEKAGVRAGDRIIKINDQSTLDLPVDKAVKLIRGPKGTTIKILFAREATGEQIERSIVRDVIDIPTIQTEMRAGTGTSTTTASGTGLREDGIFVIRLFSFTAQAPNLFRTALREFIQSGSHKLIIDLRGNPGGYLDAAWDMSSWFLPLGKTVVIEDFGKNKSNQTYKSKGYNIFGKNLKLIILVDAGSASASEIFAGALQEHGVGKLVGVKTFGKGSVQELVPITADTSLKVTIARWLTPNGHNLSSDGLTPDYEVKITQKDLETKNDTQMNKAVEILRKEP